MVLSVLLLARENGVPRDGGPGWSSVYSREIENCTL